MPRFSEAGEFQNETQYAMTAEKIADKTIGFLKTWTLTIAIITGILAYVIYDNIPALAPAGPYLEKTVGFLQPALLFAMLFLSFCRIAPRELRPRKWHAWLLLFQSSLFVILALLLCLLKGQVQQLRGISFSTTRWTNAVSNLSGKISDKIIFFHADV